MMSPADKVLGNDNTDLNQKIIAFEDYAMIYIGTKNTTSRRSITDIALNESNKWVEYNFMLLYSGKIYTGMNGKNYQWTKM